MDTKKFTVLLLVYNRHGVLSRIAGLFSKRAYNIDNLSVGKTNDGGVSRMTVVVECGEELVEQIVEQLRKLVDVIAVEAITDKPSVVRELMLVKVRHNAAASAGLIEAIDVFRGKVIDMTPESVIIEITGQDDKLNAFLQYMDRFGIIEISRTGVTALTRGETPLTDVNG
ncbi:MAG: acetolactate synthase small subunit [Clostridiales bacterium]|jgi:acetolactate synthase-1/3 small subunit|nr:acetolactate synthase small subunit [Clostridiales bacterium]